MSRLFVFDEKQQPNPANFKKYELFNVGLLKNSKDEYKQYDGLKILNLQQQTGMIIDSKCSVENFLFEIPKDKTTYHDGYLEYLRNAWYSDCGIEVAPWYIWNVILKQFSEIVKTDTNKYRPIFTNSNEKIKLNFLSDMFDIDDFINELKKYVPIDINTFIPQFPGQPNNYVESMYGLFADMVQNYYDCRILGCSIPKVRVLGTNDDWQKLIDTAKAITRILADKNIESKYLNRVIIQLTVLLENIDNDKYWSIFFYIESCGSGSQKEIKGHIKNFINDSNQTLLSTSLPKMISRYPFTHTATGIERNMNFISGIMYSSLDNDGFLVPEYHCNITEYDYNACKLTPELSFENDILIEFHKRMYKYDPEKYQANHRYIKEESYRKDCEHKITTILPYNEYIFKKKGANMMTESELQFYYKKYCKINKKNNKIIRMMETENKTYEESANKIRVENITNCRNYYFWLKNYPTITDKIKISLNEYVELLKLQKDDVEFIEQNIDIIYNYITNKYFKIFTNGILHMNNDYVIKLFMNKVKENPYDTIWHEHGYPIIRVNNDIHHPLFIFFKHMESNIHWRYFSSEVVTYFFTELSNMLDIETRKRFSEFYKLDLKRLVNFAPAINDIKKYKMASKIIKFNDESKMVIEQLFNDLKNQLYQIE
jgi:hypothetical protein